MAALSGVKTNSNFKAMRSFTPCPIPLPGTVSGVYKVTAKGAAITSSDVFTAVAQGLYEVTYYHVISRAATSSSDTQLTFTWSDVSGVTQTVNATDLSNNTLGAYTQGKIVFQLESGSKLTLATTFTSSGATAMQYSLFVTVQKLG